MMINRRKASQVLLLLTLSAALCLLLSSCGQEKAGTLRICLDIGNQFDMSEGISSQESAAKGLVDFLKAEVLLQDWDLGEIKIEVIPSSPANSSQREAMLQRIRTEIMTGGSRMSSSAAQR